MIERDFWIMLGRIGATQGMDGEEFGHIINQMISLLDEGDHEDFFGTEGWRHQFGWD